LIYGTVVADLEQRQIVDVLTDRSATGIGFMLQRLRRA
jgi:transposase